MATNRHAKLTGAELHSPYRQVFADTAARTGDATVYTSDDLYKKAFQVDTQTEYVLTDIAPVWTEMSSAATSTAAFLTSAGVTSNSPGNLSTDDFVFGSNTLDDDADPTHDYRMIFDKSRGAFRAGSASGTQFNDANRGYLTAGFGDEPVPLAYGSMCFGSYSTNSGYYSGILSGDSNTISDATFVDVDNHVSFCESAVIAGGISNQIDLDNVTPGGKVAFSGTVGSFIGAGSGNRVYAKAAIASIVGGQNNTIGESVTPTHWGAGSFIGGGDGNKIAAAGEAQWSVICGGEANTINSLDSVIVGGDTNTINISCNHGFVGGGETNVIYADYSVIVGGQNNIAGTNGVPTFGHIFIGGGTGNTAYAVNGVIGGGQGNRIGDLAGQINCFIGGGVGNDVRCSQGAIVGGGNNKLSRTTSNPDYSFIGAGQFNVIDSAVRSVIVGGGAGLVTDGNTIVESDSSGILAGADNSILGTTFGSVDRANIIVGGQANVISRTTVQTSHNFIGAGQIHLINDSRWSFIGAGNYNAINGSDYAVISGGGKDSVLEGNTITNSNGSFIGAGIDNTITGTTSTTDLANTIVGGQDNQILSSSDDVVENTIVGGFGGTITDSSQSVIVGGLNNSITNCTNACIIGGNGNAIDIFAGAGGGHLIGAGVGNSIGSGTDVGDRSVILMGNSNNIDPNASHYQSILNGLSNTINITTTGADYNTIINGTSNSLNGTFAHRTILNGNNNFGGAPYTIVHGSGNTGRHRGSFTGGTTTQGQYSIVHWGIDTADATPTEMSFDGAAATTSTKFTVPANTRYGFLIHVIGYDSTGGNNNMYKIEGMIERDVSVATTNLVFSNVTALHEDDVAADATVSADSVTDGALILTVTGTANAWTWSATGMMTELA